jgi:hypothetical protein
MNTVISSNRPDSKGYYWLGGTCGNNCAAAGGIWLWDHGEPWSYTYWDTGQPDFSNGDERCLDMWPSSINNNYKCSNCWNDAPCYSSHLYICQTPMCPAGICIYIIYIYKYIHILYIFNIHIVDIAYNILLYIYIIYIYIRIYHL